VQDRKCWRDSGGGSANDSCGRVIGLLMSDVAIPIPLPQGVMNINTSPTCARQQIYLFRLTTMTTLRSLTEGRMYKTMTQRHCLSSWVCLPQSQKFWHLPWCCTDHRQFDCSRSSNI